MPIKHHSSQFVRPSNLAGGTEKTWDYDQIKAGLLFNIRDALARAEVRADRQLRVLERIDRRLAKRIKLR